MTNKFKKGDLVCYSAYSTEYNADSKEIRYTSHDSPQVQRGLCLVVRVLEPVKVTLQDKGWRIDQIDYFYDIYDQKLNKEVRGVPEYKLAKAHEER